MARTSLPRRIGRAVAGLPARFWQWLPNDVDRRVRVIAWVSLAAQLLIIVTGGAVRLTASGLGCPTWPRCTPESFVNTPEMGIHGVIEFANRLLTFVLAAIAVLAFLAVIRFRKERPDLFRLTLFQGLSIPFQAVLGGITVLTGLNPYVVGAHFAVSIVIVSLMTVLVWRVYRGRAGDSLTVSPWVRSLAFATSAFVGITVVMGILTTGSGPHAGDNSNPARPAPRTGFDPEIIQHVHSWPAYVTLALTAVLVFAVFRSGTAAIRWCAAALLATELAQIAVGLVQANLGLPEILVGTHMLLAGLLVSAMTATVLATRTSREP